MGPRVPLNFKAHGLGLKFQRTNASQSMRFYGILADVRAMEGSRL